MWKIKITTIVVTVSLFMASFQVNAAVIKVGVISVLEGAYEALGRDGVRGVELALTEMGSKVAGNDIELIIVSSDTSPESAVTAAKKLIEEDGVEIIIGPLAGGEGIALRDLSKTYPGVTIVNGVSGAQDATLRDGAQNFFRFGGDGAQWMVGLGNYAYNKLGYRDVVVIAEDYSFPYTQVLGFMNEYCSAGGKVPEKFWTPIGTKDFSSIVNKIPNDVDALFVALGGEDAVNFLTQYLEAGGDKPIIGGTITIDQSILDVKGEFKNQLIGVPSATPTVSDYDGVEWAEFTASYNQAFPDGLSAPSLFSHHYYMGAKAAFLALEQVGGDLSDQHLAYRKALNEMEFVTPTGGIMRLDKNRNGIIDNFITEVFERPDGTLGNRVVKVVRNVNQWLGRTEKSFLTIGPVSRDNPSCPDGYKLEG